MIEIRVLSAAILGLVICGNAASASAWSVFHARCIAPLEVGALGQPVDLVAMRNFKNDGDTFSEYEGMAGAAVLRVSDGRADYSQWCSVSAIGDSANEANAFLAWSSQPDAFERYTEAEENGALVLRSLKLAVSMKIDGERDGISFRAEELDHGF